MLIVCFLVLFLKGTSQYCTSIGWSPVAWKTKTNSFSKVECGSIAPWLMQHKLWLKVERSHGKARILWWIPFSCMVIINQQNHISSRGPNEMDCYLVHVKISEGYIYIHYEVKESTWRCIQKGLVMERNARYILGKLGRIGVCLLLWRSATVKGYQCTRVNNLQIYSQRLCHEMQCKIF